MENDYYNSPYMKVLGDLKMLMKKKMLEDKLHKSQHETMDDEYGEKDKEMETDYQDESVAGDMAYDPGKMIEDMEENYMSDFMKNKTKKRKPKGSGLMVVIEEKTTMRPKGKKGKRKVG